jgi:hypothetical protein
MKLVMFGRITAYLMAKGIKCTVNVTLAVAIAAAPVRGAGDQAPGRPASLV